MTKLTKSTYVNEYVTAQRGPKPMGVLSKWIYLIAVALLLTLTNTSSAQTPSPVVSLPVHGQLALYNNSGQISSIDTFAGQNTLLASYIDGGTIRDIVWSPLGDRIAYFHGRGAASTILDVATGTSQEIQSFPGREGLFIPIEWSSDGTDILYRNYRTNLQGLGENAIDILDVETSSLTTLSSYIEGQVLINELKPLPLAVSRMRRFYREKWVI